jgi:hypothetical protein
MLVAGFSNKGLLDSFLPLAFALKNHSRVKIGCLTSISKEHGVALFMSHRKFK